MGRIADDAQSRVVLKGPSCRTGALLKLMEPEDAADTLALLAGNTPATVIALTLKQYYPDDQPPGPANLNNHRRGRCQCG